MTAPNHAIGGTVFTALFASLFWGINILASAPALVVTLIASQLPDCDHTRSPIGKLTYPIARWLNRKYGHRTLTHGIPFMVVLVVIVAILEKVFLKSGELSTVFGLAYFSHLVLDMFTLQGVPLLYPFSKAEFVLIGSRESRLRSGDWRKESVIFFLFICAGFSIQGLIEKGFWTSYNQTFATLNHVRSEFQRADDALKVTYQLKEGLDFKHGSGTCIESSENDAWLLDSVGKWVYLNAENTHRSFPEHTGRKFQIQTQFFNQISATELNQILQGKIIQHIEVYANQHFQVSQPNAFPTQSSQFKADHLNYLPVFSEIHRAVQLDTFIPDKSYRAAIQALQTEIRHLQHRQRTASDDWNDTQLQLTQIRIEYQQNPNPSDRQHLFRQIRALETHKAPNNHEAEQIKKLENQIEQVREESRLKNAAKKKAIDLANKNTLDAVQHTFFAGTVRFVVLEES